MARKRIADHIAKHMREHGHGAKYIMWGDGFLVDAAREHLSGKSGAHPLNVMTAACNAMERAPDIFEKVHITGQDCRGRVRRVRGFRLIS